MSKYQEKRRQVEARLYQGREDGKEFLKWLGRAGALFGDGRLEVNGKVVRGGDYVLAKSDGTFAAVDPLTFAQGYEEVEE